MWSFPNVCHQFSEGYRDTGFLIKCRDWWSSNTQGNVTKQRAVKY